MKLHRLQKASDYKVQQWLEKQLELTPYQKSKIRDRELIRFSPFDFYEPRQKEKVNVLWRFTIIPYMIYWVILFLGLPFTFLARGEWGYGDKLYNFHSKWKNKLKI